MAHVSRSSEYEASADDVWGKIGDFGGVDQWHPAVAKCEVEGEQRTITLGDGAQIIERRSADGPRTYSYTIEESPLPVADYEATIAVEPNGEGSRVTWSAAFQPVGVTDEEADGIIGEIFEAGLGAI